MFSRPEGSIGLNPWSFQNANSMTIGQQTVNNCRSQKSTSPQDGNNFAHSIHPFSANNATGFAPMIPQA
jgi:hypothetical protein